MLHISLGSFTDGDREMNSNAILMRRKLGFQMVQLLWTMITLCGQEMSSRVIMRLGMGIGFVKKTRNSGRS